MYSKTLQDTSFAGLRHWLACGACALVTALGWTTSPAQTPEVQIRKVLTERYPNGPKIDEVTKTPMPGLYEVRMGQSLAYTDEQGNYLIQDGHLIETKTGTDFTRARLAKITAIDFSTLALKDAMMWKQGKGTRKLAVFVDPNCSYCRMFEQELQQVHDVTVYVFLLPILGPDSEAKSRRIWCNKDSAQVWLDWMLRSELPPRFMGQCDDGALARNTDFAQRYRISGTPALVFEDGTRIPGALKAEQIEKQLLASAKSAKR